VESEQPEHPRRGRVKLLIRPGENRADVRGRVPRVQRVQPPVRTVQLGGQRREREPWLTGDPGRGDAQRQRQPRARLDQPVRGRWVAGDPFLPKVADKQFLRLRAGEHLEGEREGPLGGNQAGELAAAGHYHQAAGARRQ
jgi:hypothetical protein